MESLLSSDSWKTPLSESLSKMALIAYGAELPDGAAFDGYHRDEETGSTVAVWQTAEGAVKRVIKKHGQVLNTTKER